MNTKTLLILSLAANVLLAVVLTQKPAPTPTPAPAPSAIPVPATPKPATSSVTEPEPAATITKTNTLLRTFGWEAVESADYKQYIANLRSIGCPEETIRDIIVADVNKLYDAKKKAVRGEKKAFEYWKAGNPFLANMNSEASEAVANLEKEKNDLLRALGIEPDLRSTTMSAMVNPLETMMDFLPEDKKSKVMETMMAWQSKLAKMVEGGNPLPEDIAKIQKGMEAEIAAMLTPEENFDYQMRFSMTANIMRQTLAGFEPTQDEFVKIFNLRKEFEDEYSMLSRGAETPEETKMRKAAEDALKETIKTSLGKDRFADYEMAQDWKFQQAQTAAKRSNLGPEVAKQAWEIRKSAEDAAAELRKNKDLQKAEKDAALAAMRLEAEKSIRQLYGDEGWENYRRGNGDSWFNQIYREPKTPDAK